VKVAPSSVDRRNPSIEAAKATPGDRIDLDRVVSVPSGSGIGVFCDIGLLPRDAPVNGPKDPSTHDPVVPDDWVASADYGDSGIARNHRDRAHGERREIISDGHPAASAVRAPPNTAACSSDVDSIRVCGIESDGLNPAREVGRSKREPRLGQRRRAQLGSCRGVRSSSLAHPGGEKKGDNVARETGGARATGGGSRHTVEPTPGSALGPERTLRPDLLPTSPQIGYPSPAHPGSAARSTETRHASPMDGARTPRAITPASSAYSR